MSDTTLATPEALSVDIDPFSEEYILDPYPFHRRLRDAGGLTWLPKYSAWCATRFDDVQAMLSDPATFCSGAGVGVTNYNNETPWRPPSLLLEADPPDHTRRRAVMNRVLSAGAIRHLRAGFAEAASRLVSELLERGEFNAVLEFAEKYILKVFPDAVGVSPEGRENLLPYGNMVFNSFGPRNHIFEQSVAQAEPVIQWIMGSCARERLREGGLGSQIYAAADAGEVSHSEATIMVRSLLSAGLDTTVNGLGSAMLCFARFPAQWDKLTANPSLARAAFEEVLRFESPFQTFFRTTTRATTLGGRDIPTNTKVMGSIGACNRDPSKWERPEEFDIERNNSQQLAFGFGIHRCVGQMIARMESDVLLTELAQRVKRIELTGEPVLRLNNTLRGFRHIPVRLIPR